MSDESEDDDLPADANPSEEDQEPKKGKPKPTNLPVAGSIVDVRFYRLELKFHPDIRLEKRQRGCAFATELCELLSLERNAFESHQWEFWEPLGGTTESYFKITIVPDGITLEAVPAATTATEWIERRFEFVLDRFFRTLKPKLALQSSATVHGILPVDGDARKFLAEHLMNMETSRVGPFGRPIHVLGLRFVFPPFEKKAEDGKPHLTNWLGEARVESLTEDPSKLFLLVQGDWPEGKLWQEDGAQEAVNHLATTLDYLKSCVTLFVQQPPESSSDNNA